MRTRAGLRSRGARIALAVCLACGIVGSSAASAYAQDDTSDQVYDPLEPMNRGIFWFNDKVDTYFLAPVATGYDRAMPDPLQRGVINVLTNLLTPLDFVNNLLQLKFQRATNTVARAFVNSTVGLGGLFDHATTMGIDRAQEDFGQTLGAWGAGSGPYLVLPFMGPSNIRDAVGLAADGPLTIWTAYVPFSWNYAHTGLRVVATRAELLDTVKTLKETSFDFYAAVRNGYDQSREAAIRDSTQTTQDVEDDLYYFDEDE